jgi:hypothetical protein
VSARAAPALGDLVRAFGRLRPADAETRASIAALLGITVPEPPREPESASTPPLPTAPAQAPASSGAPRHEDTGTSRRPLVAPVPPDLPPARPLAATLQPDRRVPLRPPAWLERTQVLPEAPAVPAVPPAPEPLFDPRWTRGILGAAMMGLNAGVSIDVEHVVREVALGRPLRHLPRRPWPTFARGVQLLVDRGDAMLPFATDREWLIRRIRAVAGEENLEVLDFAGCPTRGVCPATGWQWTDYHPHHLPHPGASVVLISDLGIGRPPGMASRIATVAEWVDFAERVRRADCPLVAFVPYAPARWPTALQRRIHLVHWDRRTSVRIVRRLVGRGLRAGRRPP